METSFYSLHEFMLHTKSIVYIILAGVLVGLPLFWRFLTDHDEKKTTY